MLLEHIPISRNHGFTLIELISTITLLGILSVSVLPKVINLSNDAHDAIAESSSSALSSSIQMAHLKWLAQGSDDSSIDINGTAMAFNGNGWPGKTGTNLPTTAECQTVWDALIATDNELGSTTSFDWCMQGTQVSGVGSCVYTYTKETSVYRRSTYNLATGKVTYSSNNTAPNCGASAASGCTVNPNAPFDPTLYLGLAALWYFSRIRKSSRESYS